MSAEISAKTEKERSGEEVVEKVATHVIGEPSGVRSGDIVASFFGSTGGLVLSGLIHRLKEAIEIRAITVFEFRKRFGADYADEDRALAVAGLLAETGGEMGPFYPVE